MFDYYYRAWDEDGNYYESEDSNAFPSQFSEVDGYLFGQGTHYDLYNKLGAHKKTINGVSGVVFNVWAPNAQRVSVIGNFNNWDPAGKKLTDKKGDGVYSTVISLAPGEYEYKFVINGTWYVDPNCKEWRQNSLGTLNSVLRV